MKREEPECRFSCSPEDLSYSVFLDHVKTRPPPENQLDAIRERSNAAWVPDDAVVACYACKKQFGLFLRRHHCRLCARIFCAYCCSKFIPLPKTLENVPEQPSAGWKGWFGQAKKSGPERVCDRCHERIVAMQKVEALILAFRYVDLRELGRVSPVCKDWNRAANVCRSQFRDVQYALPGDPLSAAQRQLLRTNLEHVPGHSRLMVKAMAELNVVPTGPRRCRCWNLMCTRLCNPEVGGLECLELLDRRRATVEPFVVQRLNSLDDEELLCVLPQLVFALKLSIDPLMDMLVERSVRCVAVRTQVYWNLVLMKGMDRRFLEAYNEYIAKLDEKAGKRAVQELVLGRQLLKILSSLSFETLIKPKQVSILESHIRSCQGAPLAIKPSHALQSVDLASVQIKDSATSPAVIPMTCRSVADGSSVGISLLYKKECLVKDKVVMSIIRLMDRILKKEEGIDFCIKTYEVLPLNSSSGFIDIVLNAETLYGIQKRNFTIQNYILEHNRNASVAEVRERFVKSAAAYSVISYLLNVADRHTSNLLIDTSGMLFHIDFSYLLGFDPRPSIFSPHMRITKDIVDALGGESSASFLQFNTYCTRVFNCLRRHTYLFVSLLSILTEEGLAIDDAKYTKKHLREQILSRFIPSESPGEAQKQLQIKIETSYMSSTPRMFVDFVHYHARDIRSYIRS